jgi:hypothetical protein
VGTEDGLPAEGDIQDELGNQLARTISRDILDRYAYGAQEVEIGVRSIIPTLLDVSVGEWLSVDLPWFPEYATGQRGLRRIMQVLGVRDEDLHRRILRLEDGGPITDALLPPCIDAVDATVNREILITISPSSVS